MFVIKKPTINKIRKILNMKIHRLPGDGRRKYAVKNRPIQSDTLKSKKHVTAVKFP